LHVLLVEDDADCAACMALLLRLAGFAVEVAADGSTALAAFHAAPPDVVLMDLRLPDMDGEEVARHLRAIAPIKPLLIALSGIVREKDREQPADELFDHHLVKPVDPDEILALLGDYAESR
jgi:DNA-binding response OmpR family regulator